MLGALTVFWVPLCLVVAVAIVYLTDAFKNGTAETQKAIQGLLENSKGVLNRALIVAGIVVVSIVGAVVWRWERPCVHCRCKH